MDPRRIIELERSVAQIRQDLRSLQSRSGGVARRQPRLAITTQNYFVTPTYPLPPNPPTTDPDTGEVTPGDPHPNQFPFVFVDSLVPEIAGRIEVFPVARQFTDPLQNPLTYFAHVHNLCDVYIPVGTMIEVFEDNNSFWTSWNATTGSSTSTPTSIVLAPHQHQIYLRTRFTESTTVAYPDPLLIKGFFAGPQDRVAQMGLGFPGKTTATGTVTLSGGAAVSTDVTNEGSGYADPPTILVTGDGTGAAFSPVMTGHRVTAITIDSAGTGYTTLVLTFSAPPSTDHQRIHNISSTATVRLSFVMSSEVSFEQAAFDEGEIITFLSALRQYNSSGALISNLAVNIGDFTSLSATFYEQTNLGICFLGPNDYLEATMYLEAGADDVVSVKHATTSVLLTNIDYDRVVIEP